jgi:sulfate adenylyltransferase
MNKRKVMSVLDKMKLPNGIIWPIPIMLDVSEKIASLLIVGKPVALANQSGRIIGLLHLEEKYKINKNVLTEKLYGTQDKNHPGVLMVNKLKPIFLSGKIELFERRKSSTQEFELTPLQVRRLFEEKNWSRIVGFHTRNVIHRSHEFIQMKALEQEFCDGLFVHPVIGKKKPGDFQSKYIIDSYQIMMKKFYPKNRILFAVLATYSRYAGPREAVFTALCRKNFGCSHFIVGRDHTGVGKFYSPTSSQKIFDELPDLGIKPVKFNNVSYCVRLKTYIYEKDDLSNSSQKETLFISGTQAREIFKNGGSPPEWFMRPEISRMIVKAIKRKESVFV